MKIEAAILERTGHPLLIKLIESQPLEEGQCLVKIIVSGVCRSQLMEIEGKRGEDKWLPHLLGHEAAGEVIDVGPGVTKVKSGDRVICTWLQARGITGKGAQYLDGAQVVNSGPITTFSNYSVISESRLVPSDGGSNHFLDALLGCALPTGGGIALNELNIKGGESIAVVGLGGVGLSCLIALRAMGHKNVVGFDTSPWKLDFVKDLGHDKVFLLHSKDIFDHSSYDGPKDFDVCIEAAGSTSSIEFGFEILHRSGRLVFASHPPEGELIKLDPHALISGKNILGSWGGSSVPERDIPKLKCLIQNSTILNIERLFDKVYKLKDINAALSDLKNGEVFRPMILMEHGE